MSVQLRVQLPSSSRPATSSSPRPARPAPIWIGAGRWGLDLDAVGGFFSLHTRDGRPIANLSVATSETWRDKATGERRERTEWHRVVIFNSERACGEADRKAAVQPQDRRLGRLRRLLLGGVSHVSLNHACAAHAWAKLNRGAGEAPQATDEKAWAGGPATRAARVSAALYRVTPPRKRRFCYNPGWGNQRYSPRGGLVGCNERWLRRGSPRRRFLSRWGDQVEALGWTARDPFGPQAPPSKRHPSYSRLSRYDETGLIWVLQGRPVVALTEAADAIQSSTGAITTYRRHNKPALAPPGDSLGDLEPPGGAIGARCALAAMTDNQTS
jgi:hypothetical protein